MLVPLTIYFVYYSEHNSGYAVTSTLLTVLIVLMVSLILLVLWVNR
jgi:hypothetical protein